MKRNKVFYLAVLAGSLAVGSAQAQSPAPSAPGAKPAAPPPAPVSRTEQGKLDPRAARYYSLTWGIDSLSVKLVESGEMIRFSYRVVDAEKAKTVADKKNKPSMIDPSAGVQLDVPELEQIGMLRQMNQPEAGKSYWMAFSNSGRVVKRGDRVNVVIGLFRANALIVE